MNREGLLLELKYKAVRSSGKGGQHVNKVSTKVALQFDLENSDHLTEEEKGILKETLGSKLTKNYNILLQCGETRSQLKNKQLVTERFFELLTKGLEKQKERIPTKIPRSVKAKRLKVKKQQSNKKVSRQKPKLD